LLEPGDMVMMEHKLLALIENADLRRQLGSNARRTIEDQWTWDIQVSRLVKVLQLAVEGRR
jgi:glycosyltransferase involved in cell wall biosynthesis